jgi:hypothetical protein
MQRISRQDTKHIAPDAFVRGGRETKHALGFAAHGADECVRSYVIQDGDIGSPSFSEREEISDGLRGALLRQTDFAHQLGKARIGTQRVELEISVQTD